MVVRQTAANQRLGAAVSLERLLLIVPPRNADCCFFCVKRSDLYPKAATVSWSQNGPVKRQSQAPLSTLRSGRQQLPAVNKRARYTLLGQHHLFLMFRAESCFPGIALPGVLIDLGSRAAIVPIPRSNSDLRLCVRKYPRPAITGCFHVRQAKPWPFGQTTLVALGRKTRSDCGNETEGPPPLRVSGCPRYPVAYPSRLGSAECAGLSLCPDETPDCPSEQ
jgi:hypothetical protein